MAKRLRIGDVVRFNKWASGFLPHDLTASKWRVSSVGSFGDNRVSVKMMDEFGGIKDWQTGKRFQVGVPIIALTLVEKNNG
jgi:hypothetical protein